MNRIRQVLAALVSPGSATPSPAIARADRPAPAPAAAAPAIGHVPLAPVGGGLLPPSQRRLAVGNAPQPLGPATRAPLPPTLRRRLEGQSGLAMDHVQVHRNSPAPARLNAVAFARGADIHLAPGGERHLPHEAWHLAQQAQGRVPATRRVNGETVNDNPALEREADAFAEGQAVPAYAPAYAPNYAPAPGAPPAQRVINIDDGVLEGEYNKPTSKATKELIAAVDKAIGGDLKRGWKSEIMSWAKDDTVWPFADLEDFIAHVKSEFEKEDKGGKSKTRPNFPQSSYKLARLAYGLQTGQDESGTSLSDNNLAMPHRFPYAAIQKSTDLFIKGTENGADLDRWSDRLIEATKDRLAINYPLIKDIDDKDAKYYKKTIEEQLKKVIAARRALKRAKAKGESLNLSSPVVQTFLKWMNALHGNIPDLGPHVGVNIQVSDRLHIHTRGRSPTRSNSKKRTRSLTPGSLRALNQSPHRVPNGLGVTISGDHVVTTEGGKLDVDDLKPSHKKLVLSHPFSKTTIKDDNLKELDL